MRSEPDLDRIGRADRAAAVFAPRFVELAERSTDRSVRLTALLWAAQNAPAGDRAGARALRSLAQGFAADERVLVVLPSVTRYVPPLDEPEAFGLLERLAVEQPDPEAKARCHYYAADLLIVRRPSAPVPEAAREHLRQSLALTREPRRRDVAERALFAATTLDVGATAPEVSGRNFDGAPFELHTRRGTVVLFAFWADW